MKKILNTLYVLTPGSYLYVRNGAIAIRIGGEEKSSIPAHLIDAIVIFGQNTVSTPLIGFCAEKGITISFLSSRGEFYGRVCGPVSGNIFLRKKQFESLEKPEFVKGVVTNILYGKLRNSKAILLRRARIQENDTSKAQLIAAAEKLSELAKSLATVDNVDSMRGIEGVSASIYFAQFDAMLASSSLQFVVRTRRPPQNEVNALLSFVYTLLTREMQSALETVGLDPAAGYLHALRPGRPSFALDLLEELRAPLCDRFVITLCNRGQLSRKDFERDSGAVYLNDKGRRIVLISWQKRKEEILQHPFLNEKIPIGLIPYVQAMLFARVLRGDLDEYPPFIWR